MPGCLSLNHASQSQEKELEKAGYLSGGVLTPASSMGMLLAARLNNAGIDVKIQE